MGEALEGTRLEEHARRGYDTFIGEGHEVWLERFTKPDFVWDMRPLGLGVWQGRDEYRALLRDWVSSYESWSMTVEVVEVAGPGVTIAELVQAGRMRESDRSVELRWAHVALWEGTRLRGVVNYPSLEDARRAAAEAG
jgi:ketosteroid isomerase-like protein